MEGHNLNNFKYPSISICDHKKPYHTIGYTELFQKSINYLVAAKKPTFLLPFARLVGREKWSSMAKICFTNKKWWPFQHPKKTADFSF